MPRDTPTYSLNSDAHRVRSTNIRPPAMTWHMAFWIPQIEEEKLREDNVFGEFNNRKEIRKRLDIIFVEIAKKLKLKNGNENVTLTPFAGEVTILFDRFFKTSDLSEIDDGDISKYFGNIENIVEPIKQSDHRIIKIEFRWLDYWMTIRCGLQTEYFTIVVIAEVWKDSRAEYKKNGAINFFGKAISNPEKKYSISNPNELDLEFLFESFWKEFNSFIRILGEIDKLDPKNLFEQIFADSRGLIVEDNSHEMDYMQWAYKSVKRYREELTIEDSYECTASFVLDQRAVFMTALGPQNPNREPNSRNPLTFLVCLRTNLPTGINPINKWQLGRLIDRIQFLERTRLGALRNVKIIRSVSDELARMDQLIADARQDVASYGSGNDLDLIEVKNIELLRARLNSMSQKFLDLSEKNSRSGILYRIERSRYYVAQFKKALLQLRLSRIEGYQQYNDFIEKRLGSTYDAINLVGIRYERALRAMAAIDQNYLAAQSRNLAAQSHRASISIEQIQRRSHDLAIQSNKTNSSIEEIQRWGEIFLVFILIPYYLLGLFKTIVEYNIQYQSSMLLSGIIILTPIILYGLVKVKKMNKDKIIGIRVATCIAVIVVIFIIAASVQEKKPDPEKKAATQLIYDVLAYKPQQLRQK